MNIAILLPLKEKYTKVGAGAVSILVNTHLAKSKYKGGKHAFADDGKTPKLAVVQDLAVTVYENGCSRPCSGATSKNWKVC